MGLWRLCAWSVIATAACSGGTRENGAHSSPASDAGSASRSDAGNDSDSASPTAPDSASDSASPSDANGDSAPASDSPSDSDSDSNSDSASDSDAAATSDAASDSAPSCATGQVKPNEVVMLGDSYLDPAWGNVGPTLMMEANAMYRHYYLGGASLAWGNPNTQFFIPYQFDPMALTDPAVMNPSDIKVVIMDGGGNDVLIGDTSCETMAPPGNTSCVTTVQNGIDEAQSKMTEMAQKGVQSVVFFFYPHLDPAGGGILQTPSPAVNETLDYAYPLVEKVCCGSSFTSSLTNYSCSGQPVAGTTCVFIDTRPAFEGHLSDYIKSDHVHPTQAGAQVISDLIWHQMQAHCIAQ
ncbi:MAG TPA: SGNH/GDSL hydrolase family protein [Polyangiaceae bacterium]|nr:SGNH/GDSL hydrolase family protein [Polyangiaceae bacterium]